MHAVGSASKVGVALTCPGVGVGTQHTLTRSENEKKAEESPVGVVASPYIQNRGP